VKHNLKKDLLEERKLVLKLFVCFFHSVDQCVSFEILITFTFYF
jgi:hypothetical protein